MGGGGNGVQNVPDPDLIDALATKWLNEAADLQDLATLVGGIFDGGVWTGAPQVAAEDTEAAVGAAVQGAAGNVTKFGQSLQQYAAQVRQAIAQEKASFWAQLAGLVFAVLSLGLGYLIAPVINMIADAITSLGLSVEAATFAANALVTVPIAVTEDIGAQLIGDAVAGVPPGFSLDFLAIDILGGLEAGAGLAADADVIAAAKTRLAAKAAAKAAKNAAGGSEDPDRGGGKPVPAPAVPPEVAPLGGSSETLVPSTLSGSSSETLVLPPRAEAGTP